MTGQKMRVFSAIGAGVIALLSALLLATSTVSAAGTVSITSATADQVGGEATTTLTADSGGDGLTTWSITVQFEDTDYLAVPSCAASAGVCQIQPGGVLGVIRFAGGTEEPGGITGNITLGTITFNPGISAGTCTDVTVSVQIFTGTQGPIDPVDVTGGQVCVEEASESATPTAGPTNGGSPTATATTNAPTATTTAA